MKRLETMPKFSLKESKTHSTKQPKTLNAEKGTRENRKRTKSTRKTRKRTANPNQYNPTYYDQNLIAQNEEEKVTKAGGGGGSVVTSDSWR